MGALRFTRRLRRLLPKPATSRRPAGAAVNGYDILNEVAALPISTWRYEWEADHIRHLGPMAQDWMAAFGLGDNDEVIHAGDASGVALVCIQALHREVLELRAEVDRLRGQMTGTDSDVGSPGPG